MSSASIASRTSAMAGESGFQKPAISSDVTPWTADQKAAVACSIGGPNRPAAATAVTLRRSESYEARPPGVGLVWLHWNIRR